MSDLQSRIETLWAGRDTLAAADPEVIATAVSYTHLTLPTMLWV